MNKTYTVVARNLVPLDSMHEDDQAVVGVYEVEVQGVESHAEGDLVEAVLDLFHNNQGIEVLDDFDIEVYNERGVRVVAEDDSKAPDDVTANDPVFLSDDPDYPVPTTA